MLFKLGFSVYLAALVGLTISALPTGEGQADAQSVERAAGALIRPGTVQPARSEDKEWEVDVSRPDGSLVEVTFDDELRLRGFDEEIGPGGRLAVDELRGAARARAVRAARPKTGPGRVTSVERDSADEIEVNVRRSDGTQVEVELDSRLRVRNVEREDPGDE